LPPTHALRKRWWLPCCKLPSGRSLRLAQRAGPYIQHAGALTDGAEALQQQVVTQFPEHTLILDIIPATEYLWATANALLGETHPHRTAWVRAYLESLLAGQTGPVSTALEAEANDAMRTATQRPAVRLTSHWEAWWELHRHQQHQRLYGRIAPAPALAEVRALEWAA
jgi:hypothetical protein